MSTIAGPPWACTRSSTGRSQPVGCFRLTNPRLTPSGPPEPGLHGGRRWPVLYDAVCGFCKSLLSGLLRWDRAARLHPIALQRSKADGVPRELTACQSERQLIATTHYLLKLWRAPATKAPARPARGRRRPDRPRALTGCRSPTDLTEEQARHRRKGTARLRGFARQPHLRGLRTEAGADMSLRATLGYVRNIGWAPGEANLLGARGS